MLIFEILIIETSFMLVMRIILSFILLTSLNSCAFLFGEDGMFPDPGDGYLEAELSPEMIIPSQLDSYTLSS